MQNLSGRPFVAGVLATLTLAAILVSARTVTEQRRGDPSTIQSADLNARKSLIMHDIGNVRMTLSNWGEQGNPDGAVGFKGFGVADKYCHFDLGAARRWRYDANNKPIPW